MAVCINKEKNEIIVTCGCGCDNSYKVKLDPCWDDPDCDEFLWISYLSNDVDYNRFSLREKFKKIWCIITGKDYCYNEVVLSRDEVKSFAQYLNNTLKDFKKE